MQAVGFEEAPEEDGDSEDDLQVPLVMCPLELGAATQSREKRLEAKSRKKLFRCHSKRNKLQELRYTVK